MTQSRYNRLNRLLICYFFCSCLFMTINCQTDDECMRPYCYCKTPVSLLCQEFHKFSELDFKRTKYREFQDVEIMSRYQKLDLNDQFSLFGLNVSQKLVIGNVKSFSAFYNPFDGLRYKPSIEFFFINSTFEFTQSDDVSPAVQDNVLVNCRPGPSNLNYIFSNLHINTFTICNIDFPRQMCPILFKNSKIQRFKIINPLGQFGFRKVISDSLGSTLVSANIGGIEFSYTTLTFRNLARVVRLDADTILNVDLFATVTNVKLLQIPFLEEIDENTFKLLRFVKVLEIQGIDLKKILTRTKKWLGNLNYDKLYDIESQSLTSQLSPEVFKFIVLYDSFWQYQNGDIDNNICLFKYFNHHKLIYPTLLYSTPQAPCTCVIYWLYKYFHKYTLVFGISESLMPLHCFKNVNYTNEIEKCQFDNTFRQCRLTPEELYPTSTPATTASVITTAATASQTHTTPTHAPTLSTTSGHTISIITTPSNPTSTQIMSSSAGELIDPEAGKKLEEQTRTNFAIAVTLLILCILLVIAVIFLYIRLFFSKKRNETTSKLTAGPTLSSIDASF